MPLDTNYSHLAFSDDSNHEDGRFSSLCLLTFSLEFENIFRSELEKIFEESDVKNEFKWQKVSDAKYKFAAEKIHSFVFKNLDKIRLDILLWDKSDTRHVVSGRDDNKNIGRMYYHLVQNTLSKRWGEEASWFWQPDHQSGVNWEDLGNFLVTKKYDSFSTLFDIKNEEFRKLRIRVIKPACSHEEIFVQLADYFAGLGAYSYGHYNKYKQWYCSRNQCLFLTDQSNLKYSRSELVRFDLLEQFNNYCKEAKLTVSFNSTCGLRTHNPSKQINFWLYMPQNELDKAPKK